MRKIAFLVAAACAFAATPYLKYLGAVPSAVAAVGLGIGLAMAASSGAYAVSIAAGSIGALAAGLLAPVSGPASGAVFLGLVFAERTLRVRGRTSRALHVLLALVGGAIAGGISSAYATASLPVMAVATVVCSVLVALPMLVDADDPIAHALDQAASLVAGRSASLLHEGADLRRSTREIPLETSLHARVEKTWAALLKLADARVKIDRRPLPTVPLSLADDTSSDAARSPADAVLEMVDGRIAEHVKVLARAYTAVNTANAARIGLDDAAVKSVATVGDSLDEVSRTIVEDATEVPPLDRELAPALGKS